MTRRGKMLWYFCYEQASMKPTSKARLVRHSNSSRYICCESGHFSTSDGICKRQYAPIKSCVLKHKNIRATNQLFVRLTKIIVSRNTWTVSFEVYGIGMRQNVRIQNYQCSKTEQAIETIQYSVWNNYISRCSACNLTHLHVNTDPLAILNQFIISRLVHNFQTYFWNVLTISSTRIALKGSIQTKCHTFLLYE